MQKLSISRLPVLAGAALAFWAAAAHPASAQWSVSQDRQIAGIQDGEQSFAYICNETREVLSIITPNRLPMIGSWPNSRLPTTYRVDSGAEREAGLFLRSEDLEKPQYIYTLIIDVRGGDTTMDDMIDTLASGEEFTIDMWGIERTFSLTGFRRAVNVVRRDCT